MEPLESHNIVASPLPPSLPLTSFLYFFPPSLCSTPVVTAETIWNKEQKWTNMITHWDVWIGPKKHKVRGSVSRDTHCHV